MRIHKTILKNILVYTDTLETTGKLYSTYTRPREVPWVYFQEEKEEEKKEKKKK